MKRIYKQHHKKKSKQLGIHVSTAMNRLRKNIMFSFAQRLNEDICYRCNEKIETVEEFSIEHKEDWLDNNVNLFWNLDNISFSHLSCNAKHAKKGGGFRNKIISPDGYSWCNVCKQHKPINEFYKDRSDSGKNGLRRKCISCNKTKYADMVELVYTPVLETGVERHVGSSPTICTKC